MTVRDRKSANGEDPKGPHEESSHWVIKKSMKSDDYVKIIVNCIKDIEKQAEELYLIALENKEKHKKWSKLWNWNHRNCLLIRGMTETSHRRYIFTNYKSIFRTAVDRKRIDNMTLFLNKKRDWIIQEYLLPRA